MKSYEGNEPYIFISYAHKDSDRVLPIVKALSDAGFRVWYDAGIEAGTEWPEYIAGHLLTCNAMLAFVSENFDRSQNCRREIHYAVHHQKNMLAVYLENFRMSAGMELQLGAVQSIFSDHHSSRESLVHALTNNFILKACHIENTENQSAQHNAPLLDFTIENGVLIKYLGTSGKVTIPDSVFRIALLAFMGNTTVTEILPSDKTSLDFARNVYHRNKVSVLRNDNDTMYRVMTAWKNTPYLVSKNDTPIGYFTLTPDKKSVSEAYAIDKKSYLDTLVFQVCLFLNAVLIEDGLKGGKVCGKV